MTMSSHGGSEPLAVAQHGVPVAVEPNASILIFVNNYEDAHLRVLGRD